MRTLALSAAITVLAATNALTGCSITKSSHGDGDNVKIATPFGGLQVKTNDANVLGEIGLPAYPGATPVKKQKDDGKDDDGSADVNLSFGSFELKVKAASFRTGDSPDKVLAFYKKGLGRFGNVIQCDGKHPVGTPVRTSEGLTCDDRMDHGKIQDSVSDSKIQLKAGSKKRQHNVDIDPEGAGTKFSLFAVDLPTDFHFGSGKDNDDKDDQQ